MRLEIRLARAEDADAIWQIERASFSLPWTREALEKEICENACARYLVLLEEGVPAAYAGMWLMMREAHVTTLAVRADSRRRGYAEKLMRALIQLAADTGLSFMTLECRRTNVGAQALYHKLGFLDVGFQKRYYEDNGEDALVMALVSLPPANPEADPRLVRFDPDERKP